MLDRYLLVAQRPRGLPALVLGLALCAACNGDGLKPQPLVDHSQLYWALELNEHAVTLATTAPYDTLTLTAVPRNVAGEPLDGDGTIQYTTLHPELVQVSPQGVLHAVAVTPDCCWDGFVVPVVATMTMGNIKHADTVLVKVIAADTLPVLGSISMHPVPPDVAKAPITVASARTIAATCFNHPLLAPFLPWWCAHIYPVRILDSAGAPMPPIPIAFSSSDPNVAKIANLLGWGVPGEIVAARPGSVTFYVRTTVLGVTKADTVQFQIGWPKVRVVDPIGYGGHLEPETKIAAGGIVIWVSNGRSYPIDFVFDDPTNVMAFDSSSNLVVASYLNWYCGTGGCDSGGNFVFPADTTGGETGRAIRSFPVPGTYNYHSTALGSSGRVVVVGDQ